MLWPEEAEWVGFEIKENPVMTFPIKNSINTELFIDKTAALYILVGLIKDENMWGWSTIGTGWSKHTVC